MSILVDMHNQLLKVPGSRYTNEKETIRILKSAADDGVTHMIATPSFRYGDYMSNGPTIEHFVNKLNEKLASYAIPIIVLAGMDITLYERLPRDIKVNARPLAESNKYVLIGFQDNCVPSIALTVFLELQLMGYIPIIANAERNKELTTNTKKLLEFINRGALVHVGAASILGLNGRKTRKTSLKLCRKGLVHFISSASPDFERRPSHLKDAYKYLERKLSPDTVKYFMQNAESILSGTDFHSRTGVENKVK